MAKFVIGIIIGALLIICLLQIGKMLIEMGKEIGRKEVKKSGRGKEI